MRRKRYYQSRVNPKRIKYNVSLPVGASKKIMELSERYDITNSYAISEIVCSFFGMDNNGKKVR